MKPSKETLTVGSQWRTRNGCRFVVCAIRPEGKFPVKGWYDWGDDGHAASYGWSGIMDLNNGGLTDLIRPWEEPWKELRTFEVSVYEEGTYNIFATTNGPDHTSVRGCKLLARATITEGDGL